MWTFNWGVFWTLTVWSILAALIGLAISIMVEAAS
jgi:hypothetical protein